MLLGFGEHRRAVVSMDLLRPQHGIHGPFLGGKAQQLGYLRVDVVRRSPTVEAGGVDNRGVRSTSLTVLGFGIVEISGALFERHGHAVEGLSQAAQLAA